MTGSPSVVRFGERALLVEAGGPAAAAALRRQLRRLPLPGQRDVVSGAVTVVVTFDRAERLAAARTALAALLDTDPPADPPEPGPPAHPVVLDTVYDGADLAEVGRLSGLGAEGVIAAHAAAEWTVSFTGFAPGFGYLTGTDPRLRVARRPTARTRVPAGAVGLAGEFSGVYPRESPGGWQLIGRSDAALWRLKRDPPALLRPGVRVRFRAVDQLAGRDGSPAGGTTPTLPMGTPPVGRNDGPQTPGPGRTGRGLLVVRPGMLTTVQDLGRPGLADLGVGESGAADRGAAARANAAVGNPVDAALLETVLGGLRLRARGEQLLALAGAVGPVSVSGSGHSFDADAGRRIQLPDGAEIRLATPMSGLRGYLAVRGGIAVASVLGSRSTDQLSGLGPPPLRAGDLLPIGGPWPARRVATSTHQPEPPPDPDEPVLLGALPGPHLDRFTAAARETLFSEPFAVDSRSNRVGVRLIGPALNRTRDDELPPLGLVPGAIQVPPDGHPVIFLADHPVTGGYPIIGVLTDTAIDRAAQLRPGRSLRFARWDRWDR